MKEALFAIGLLVLLIGSVGAAPAIYGHASIYAPAVILSSNQGSLTIISVNVSVGNGSIAINGPKSVANSTFDSAKEAVACTAKQLGINSSKYNFTYFISNASEVSGPSGGAALTLLAISALTHRPLNGNFTITGTISGNCSIGQIGGVYDKAGIAKKRGLEFMLVPYAANQSMENELYYLVQQHFGIPLIEVTNITQAEDYAFNGLAGVQNISKISVKYNPYTSLWYNITALPNASLTCSNNCNNEGFNELTNFTVRLDESSIQRLYNENGFAGLAENFTRALNISKGILHKGYLYTGDDFAFLNYVDSSYFGNSNTSISKGYYKILSIENYCKSLIPPQINNNNYEYVIEGEMRQAWGEYVINQTISNYNESAVDTDQVLDMLYLAGEANGWCSAAGNLYNYSSNINGTPMQFSQNLKSYARSLIYKAINEGQSMYLDVAINAYNQSNYTTAILSADYAIMYGSKSPYFVSNNSIYQKVMAIASNATYGAWATQFANQALFYAYESEISTNSTKAAYTNEALTTALLASNISASTREIAKSLEPFTPSLTYNNSQIQQYINNLSNQISSQNIEYLQEFWHIFMILSAIIIIEAVSIVILLYLLKEKIRETTKLSNNRLNRLLNKKKR
ncbi:MAG: S16 family serine protease [Candidatus Micrarchaeia archaeon]